MGYQTPYTFVRRMAVLFAILGSLVCSLYVVFVHAEVQNVAYDFQNPSITLNGDHGWEYMQCNSSESTARFPDNNGKCDNGGVLHPGVDLNGPDGKDTDQYQPVFATANGLVTYAANSGNGYGNLVVIRHTLPDGSQVWSAYAHLEDNSVSNGQLVSIGQQIGRVGKSGGQTYAHLHFEIRVSDFPATQWTNTTDTPNSLYNKYVDPLVFINNFNYYSKVSSEVKLFDGSFFRGDALSFFSSGIWALGSFENTISSLAVPFAWTVTGYDSNNGTGDYTTFTASDPNLSNNGFTDGVSSKGSADNTISSITIYGGDCSSQLIAASAQAAKLVK